MGTKGKHWRLSEETKAKMRKPKSPQHCLALSAIARSNWTGGSTGDAFAGVLCPLGYQREFSIFWGTLNYERFIVDFAHPEIKVCFELDGPGHKASKLDDAQRDEVLRYLGWKIIHIRHHKEG